VRIAVIAAAVGCAAIAASPAEALTTVRKSAPIVPTQGSIASVTATCPPGTNVVSGGFEARDDLTNDPSAVLVFQSKRKGTRSWTTSAIDAVSNANPGTLTVSAYCDPKAPVAKQVSMDQHLGPFEVKTAKAQCPKGKTATAGGFFVAVTSDFTQAGQIVSSFRTGKRTWAATGAEENGADTHVTSLGYCTGGVKHPKTETGPGRPFTTGSPATDRSPKCPKSPGVRSGGFTTVPGDSPQYTIFESLRQGRTWIAGGRGIDNGSTIHAIAYCP
jgi:hypothetical protein